MYSYLKRDEIAFRAAATATTTQLKCAQSAQEKRERES